MFLSADAKDISKLNENNITHIVSLYDNPYPVLQVSFP